MVKSAAVPTPARHRRGQALAPIRPSRTRSAGCQSDPQTTKHKSEHDGHHYYFCSVGCRTELLAVAAKYLSPRTVVAAAPVPEGTIYTCPMHPQIRQDGPGSCPVCGMALEPLTVTAEAPLNPELAVMTRRFWIGLALTLPIFILEMGGHVPALGLDTLVPIHIATWIQFALSTPVVLWAGWPFFERGWASVVHRSLNMFSLISLGTGAAYLYSLVETFVPGLFPADFREMGGMVAVYFEPAAVIVVLCYSAKCWSCAPVIRPAARFALC